MSYKHTNAVFEYDGVQGVAKAVLLVLAYYTNEKTELAWPSIATISRRAGWGITAVKAALAELRKQGLIHSQGTKPSRNGPVIIYSIDQVVFRPGRDETGSGDGADQGVSRPTTRASRGGDQVATRPENLELNREEEQAIEPARPASNSSIASLKQGEDQPQPPDIERLADRLSSLVHPSSHENILPRLRQHEATLNGDREAFRLSLAWFLDARDAGMLREHFPNFRETTTGYSLSSIIGILPKITAKFVEVCRPDLRNRPFQIED